MRRIFCLIAVITAVFALGLTASADTLYGDVNCDGSVEPLDAVVLSRHLAAWTGYETLENPANADLDQDGKVGTVDVVILMRHLAEWNGYIELPFGYEPITEPTFVVSNASANAGDTVEVVVKVVNNPGILGMTMKLEYDESVMTLVDATNGEAFAPLKMTPPKKYKSGCNFVWYADDLADEDVVDGSILVLTFDVSANAASGTYPITVKYTDGNIFDVNLDPINVDIKNGVFTISGDTGDEPDVPVVPDEPDEPDEPEITEPTFVVTKVSANAGDTVEVVVKVVKNPGILGMTMKLEYDASVLTLVNAENGEAFAPLKMTPPKTYKSGCNFVWYADDIDDSDVVDGDILVLTFDVSATAASGTYPVTVKYNDGNIFDVNLDPISVDIKNGEITVK